MGGGVGDGREGSLRRILTCSPLFCWCQMNVINLNRHGAAMQSAWKSVLDADDATDWALFGYEGSQG